MSPHLANGLTVIPPALVPCCFVTSVIFIVGLLVPSLAIRRVFFLCMVAIDTFIAFFATVGNPWQDHGLANTYVSQLLLACDFLVLHDPQRDYHRIDETKYRDLPWWKRIMWAFELSTNMRGIGWNWEAAKVHPPHPSDSMGRFRFVLRQVVRWAFAYVIGDLKLTLFRKRPACHAGGSFFQDGPGWLTLYVAAFYSDISFGMILTHSLLAGVCVLLGISKPSHWPNLFGGFQQAYTVRRFWGRAWHQLCRQFLTANAQFVSRSILGVKKGNPLLRYLELYLTFFLSGAVHWVGSYALLRHHTGANRTMLFFLLQAAVITLEDFIVAFGKRLGIKDGWSVRLLGYVWVVAWLVLLTPIWTEPLVKAGFLELSHQNEFSLVQGIWEGKWHPGYERTGL
ncbi:hypothetical protein CALCODRAFT_477393 [Calocera cornea HHB12733]|uniref:Wax synthase domain-containing protein n=1 Tax=Calocera cornea HHB12733 TaxID=1353952 RepID=A0A165CRA2_9BASI|nr:hypothetical protein CALCODRAFT_477393 [Calocera cornea HHB12733]